MNTTNPLMQIVPIAFLALLFLVCWLTWRTVRGAWVMHSSPEGLQKRQLKDARREYLMHQLAAEQHAAAAAGLLATINRLSGPPMHGQPAGMMRFNVGAPSTTYPPENYSAHDKFEDVPNPTKPE